MIRKETAEHYTWGDDCDGWHLVRQPELSIIQERMPPGTAEARHYHRSARQFFFVLAGTLTIELDGQLETLSAQQGLEIAPNTPHRVFNDSAEVVEFLVVSQPPSHGDRVVVDT